MAGWVQPASWHSRLPDHPQPSHGPQGNIPCCLSSFSSRCHIPVACGQHLAGQLHMSLMQNLGWLGNGCHVGAHVAWVQNACCIAKFFQQLDWLVAMNTAVSEASWLSVSWKIFNPAIPAADHKSLVHALQCTNSNSRQTGKPATLQQWFSGIFA